ncbi:hypothetical protein, variant 4 [Verruconis gallopava]|uniref:Uncharacterized protein n=1 Tax=Verruconis gallopava TaxID=253628 RepID=A0A0D2BCX6_9PEZI|nr:uncharacterized protein PV09_00203 [Verruconis gallopava]XP_016219152.1 hypothetical protein, variant 1 [Verruconis gallopava]XP_016219153.1 hypothetical protein, variant 2 [Verruconis gallopava]XP_016219154.1 hypothetical protein, variant 3 [Verruconis gallopava]XP_016219155.1 hypothetical protein, variant 4 [Verruconis gallopava]KIW09282.1 hypothetical protein PV09_00203 [Verruconis gallopava]KIW09283.1 hypothetical protein, variant 1 [Verruconis gallopava]KIW09284.1 hypothetical protei
MDMSVDDIDARLGRARKYVEEFPNDVVVFLSENFSASKIEAAIKASCERHKKRFDAIILRERPISSPNNNLQTTFDLRPSYGATHGPVPQESQIRLPTPPNSQTSESTGSVGMILAVDEDNHEWPLYISRANIQNNWIRANIVNERLRLGKAVCRLPERVTCVQHGATLSAIEQVVITWREPQARHSNYDAFLLADSNLQSDVVFGEQAYKPTRPGSDYSPSHHPIAPAVQRPMHESIHPAQSIYLPMDSQLSEGTIRQIYPQYPARPNSQNMNLQASINQWNRQTYSATPIPTSPMVQAGADHNQPTVSAHATSTLGQFMKFKVQYDGSSLPVDIDLGGNGDALCAKLESKFTNLDLDRSTFQLRFSTRMNHKAADAKFTVVRLGCEDLEDDWEDAVAWIRERETRIYVSIEPIEPG